MGWKTGRLVAGFPGVMVAGCWEIGVIVTDCLETRGAVAGFSETGSKVEVVGNDGIVLGGA